MASWAIGNPAQNRKIDVGDRTGVLEVQLIKTTLTSNATTKLVMRLTIASYPNRLFCLHSSRAFKAVFPGCRKLSIAAATYSCHGFETK